MFIRRVYHDEERQICCGYWKEFNIDKVGRTHEKHAESNSRLATAQAITQIQGN